MSENPLVVVGNPVPAEMVVAQRFNALSKLFQLKPKALELVSKSTQQTGAVPGTFRVISTNEKFDEMRAVMLYAPVEQREKYTKGKFSAENKECFSLDNVQPHHKAKNPPAMYCATCPDGDVRWVAYREAAKKGITGEALSAYLPPCRKYWHLFLAARDTLVPYYFNVKGTSVKPFEQAMQTVAELFMKMNQNIVNTNNERTKSNLLNLTDVPLLPVPTDPNDLIWHISFTMFTWQKNGGVFMLGLKDFKVMNEEDKATFSKILADYASRRAAGAIQSQEAADAEAEATLVTEESSSTPSVASGIAEKNKQIMI
jgi:hypothetical protein